MTRRRVRFRLVTIRFVVLLAVVAMAFAADPGRVSGQNQTNFAIGNALVVNTDALNLRAGATRSAGVLAVLGTGAAVTIISEVIVADTVEWYGVDPAAGSGYVAGLFLGDSVTVSLLHGFAVGDTLVVDTEGLNLRTSASVDASVMAILAAGDPASIVNGPVGADGQTWYQVATGSGIGWVVCDFLAFTRTIPSDLNLTMGTIVTVDTDGLNLRGDPTIAGEVLAMLELAAQVAVLDGPESADGYTWYQVLTDGGGIGWVAVDFLALG